MDILINELKTRFAIADVSHRHQRQGFISIPKEQAVSLLTHLRDVHGFTHLVMVTCVDWLEQDRFQLTYLLHNYSSKTDLGVMVYLPRENTVMESIHHLWEHARVYQREMFEMFGIDFPGSPGVHEPMILEGWQGPPVMRRDFDTKEYSDASYSHRPREIHEPEAHMKQKLYPED